MSSARAGLQATGNATPYTAAATVIPRPTFLDDDDQDVDEHPLHCSICCDISFDPVITPCQHVFCRECITSGLQSNPSCPNDRRALTANSLLHITSLHEYVYNRTLVKCPRCDKWSGQMQQYKIHVPTCTSSSYVQTLERKVQQLTTQLGTQRQATEALIRDHAAEKGRLQSQNDELVSAIDVLRERFASMGPLFDTQYGYYASSATDLSIVISRYLRNKPSIIDSNRIFNCVQRCHDESRRLNDYWIRVSVCMLLVTCYRSNWFSENQRTKILNWYLNLPTWQEHEVVSAW